MCTQSRGIFVRRSCSLQPNCRICLNRSGCSLSTPHPSVLLGSVLSGGIGSLPSYLGLKRKDYRSIRNGLEGLVDGARSALSGDEGRAQWTGVYASVGGAIEQASQIRRNRILERIKACGQGSQAGLREAPPGASCWAGESDLGTANEFKAAYRVRYKLRCYHCLERRCLILALN